MDLFFDMNDKHIQNHRVAEVGSDLWRSSGPTSLLRQGHQEPVSQDYVQMPFWYIQGLCQGLHSIRVFSDVQTEPPFQHILVHALVHGDIHKHKNISFIIYSRMFLWTFYLGLKIYICGKTYTLRSGCNS